MDTNIDIEDIDVEIVEITPKGDIYVERDVGSLVLFSDKASIDLKRKFNIINLTVIQEESQVTLESIGQLNYLTAQLQLQEANHECTREKNQT